MSINLNNIPFKEANSANFSVGRSGHKIEYIIIHYTANSNDKSVDNLNYFARTVTKTSAHYFVDENGAGQSVKDENTAYAVGAKSYIHEKARNYNSLSIEMCNSLNSVPEAVRQNTIILTAYKMKQYNIPIENVLMHNQVTGKICPRPWVNNPNEWTRFKEDLQKYLKGDDDEDMDINRFDELMQEWLKNQNSKPADSWANDPLEWVKTNGIMIGDENGNQTPQAFTKRQEMSTMLRSFYNKFIAPIEEKLK